MSHEVFGQAYAAAYDSFYGQKDYAKECDVLEDLFRDFADSPVTSILDLGCGTGSHAVVLAERGYRVTGVDLSGEMLRRAAEKASEAGVELELAQADLTSYRDHRPYDAVLMMFAVLGYQQTNDQVMEALRTAREHLRPGGVFVADFWYGPAVLRERPTSRATIRERGPRDLLIRIAEPTLEPENHLCHVDYRVLDIEDGVLLRQASERHTMRYFFPKELEAWCSFCGLVLQRLLVFPQCDRSPTSDDWNALLVTGRQV